MPDTNFQDLLSAIYFSSAERTSYFKYPKTVAELYGINDPMFSPGTKESIELYAQSLKQKRLEEILAFLPVMTRLYRDELAAAFDLYCEIWIPSGPNKNAADLLAFADFLFSHEECLSADARDLLQFEVTPWRLNFHRREKKFIFKYTGNGARVTSAFRRRSGGFRMAFYRKSITQLMDPHKKPFFFAKSKRVGIYFKIPFFSKVLEWYLPVF